MKNTFSRLPDKAKKAYDRFLKVLTSIVNLGFLKNSKIQTRLITSFILLSLLPLGITGIVSYNESRGAIRSKINTYSEQLMIQIGSNIAIELDKYEKAINEISMSADVQEKIANYSQLDQTERSSVIDEMERRTFVSKFSNNKNLAAACLIFEKDGSIKAGPKAWQFLKNLDFIEKIKKDAGRLNGKLYWGYEEVPGGNNNKGIIVAKKIISNTTSKEIGYMFIVINDTLMSNAFKNTDIGKDSEIFVVNSKGMILANATGDNIGKIYDDSLLPEMINESMNNISWVKSAKLKDGNHLIASSKIRADLDWYVIGKIPYTYLNGETDSIRNKMVIMAGVCLILAFLIAFIIAKSISSPVTNVVKLMREAKEGNLLVKIKEKRRDEIGELSANFADMANNIRILIKKVDSSATKVLENSQIISTSAMREHLTLEQVAASMQGIAKGSSEQAFEIVQAVGYMGELSNGISIAENSIEGVSKDVKNVSDLSEKTRVIVNLLNEKTVQTSQVSSKIVSDINDLSNDMKQIMKIVRVITGIADQTNLLSLNAAIEASRAGAAGMGFAVVAEEVKKLAEQARYASQNISDIIGNIQIKTQNTVNTANVSSIIIKEQQKAVEQTDGAFNVVLKAMEDITKGIGNVGDLMWKLLDLKERTLNALESISTVSQEAAAITQEVCATTDQQIKGSKGLSNLADNLYETARELDDAIKIFKM